METVIIPQRGVERHKAPTLADDGGSIECINLRPSADGLDLAHDKKHLFTSQFGADAIDDNITAVYRHRALPENWFVVVLNHRKMVVFTEKDGSLSPTLDERGNIEYFAKYGEDIQSIGELNNVLVVRIADRQDCYLWFENGYRLMPAIKMPQQMSLSQDFTADPPKNVSDRPFFQAVIGFNTPNVDGGGTSEYNSFVKKYNDNRDRCLQFIQGLRSEEEATQRKLGKFVGHVLVRCAFKTAQDNYISYGTVLHAEIGAWASTYRKSTFPKSKDAEKTLPYYKRTFEKIMDDYTVAPGLIYDTEENGKNGYCVIPVACFRANVKNDGGKFGFKESKDGFDHQFSFRHDGIASSAGYSQLPVFVGAIPFPVWKTRTFRGNTKNNNARHGIRSRKGTGSDWNEKAAAIGVYAPAIHYSYPILRMIVDDDFVEALEFYRKTKIITSLCVAMTAPVKHGSGTTLHKVHTIENNSKDFTVGFGNDSLEDDDADEANIDSSRLTDDPGNKDYMHVYGYPRNPDANPERLMNRNFYIVKDIGIDELLNMIDGNLLEIPLQLKDIGAIEKTDAYGNVTVEISQEVVDNSQEDQTDPNYVSLNTIESAKPLPTDSFSTHTLLGSSYMEYNRRLHLFGVSVLMSEGYTPTASLEYDQDGFGRNRILRKGDAGFVDNLYMEAVIQLDKKVVIRRTPVNSYMTQTDVNGNSMGNIILNDILTYPDYRCSQLRLVQKYGDHFYQIGDAFECKSSVLNNLAYAANTFDTQKDLPKITFESSDGLSIHTQYEMIGSGQNLIIKHHILNINDNCKDNPQKEFNNDAAYSVPFTYDISRPLCAYKDDDILIYKPRLVDLNNVNYDGPLDYSNIDDSGRYEDSNRVQVSETDDVFSYPAVNSYRAGSIENKIIAANSVYGQVTEQKFGMWPIYLFTKEGVYIMEQGTGNILYGNVSKINDDVLSDKRSICNAGNMVAYATLDGLRLIQGRESQQVSDVSNGTPFIDLCGDASPFLPTVSEIPDKDGRTVSFAGYLSRVRFADEIQRCEMLWDSYNREVVLLCRQGDRAVTWAYNVASQQMYKRKDILNDRAGFGVVLNGKNLVWCGRVFVPGKSRASAPDVNLDMGGGETVMPGEPLFPSLKVTKGFDIYDFNTSDQETAADGTPDKQQFLYVSTPVKAGSPGYKHIEHSVLRMFGQDLDMVVEYYGSLDGRKWFRMGGGRIAEKEEYSDMLMRRMPCSTRYIVVVIKGNAAKLQINRLEAEVQARYATRLR